MLTLRTATASRSQRHFFFVILVHPVYLHNYFMFSYPRIIRMDVALVNERTLDCISDSCSLSHWQKKRNLIGKCSMPALQQRAALEEWRVDTPNNPAFRKQGRYPIYIQYRQCA